MSSTTTTPDESLATIREITLTSDRAMRLKHLAQTHQVSESQVVERALDILFSLSELFSETLERQAWHRLSEASLYRLWDNEQDAVYDNWRELYGVPEG